MPPSTLKFHFPFKPFVVTQQWGNLNPAYSAQFGDPNFKRHNGVDAVTAGAGEYGRRWGIWCPVQGFKVSEVAYYPNGGGNQLALISKEKLLVGDKMCYVSLLFCHGHKILLPVGYEPEVGELMMIANNTGFSTGPHTHIGMYRLTDSLQKLDSNEATGSYNPAAFYTGEYAVDKASVATLVKSGLRYVNYLSGLI